MSKKDKKNKEKDTIFEEPRKAVIIGETFTNLLNPIDNELPYLLLPVCGIPIIEYMLDSLNTTKSKIEEIIIVVNILIIIIDQKIKKIKEKNYLIIKIYVLFLLMKLKVLVIVLEK